MGSDARISAIACANGKTSILALILQTIIITMLLTACGGEKSSTPHQVSTGNTLSDCVTKCHSAAISASLDPTTINGAGTAGKHVVHVQNRNIGCEKCHLNYIKKETHMNGRFDTTDPAVQPMNFDLKGPNGAWISDTGPQTGSCSSVACHGTDTLDWYGTTGWTMPDCETCHTGLLDPLVINGQGQGGKHIVHVKDMNIDCDECHLNYTEVITHMNGTLDTAYPGVQIVNFDSSNPNGQWTSDTGPQTGGCSTVACHGTDTLGWYGTDTPSPENKECAFCHGHDLGYEYSPGKLSQGRGTSKSHSTHTENDSDDLRGPHITCGDCHDVNNMPYFKSGTDKNSDGRYDLSETYVCDACHSKEGRFDGVDAPAIGAKNNWKTGVYTDSNSLAVGKEKWCLGCHDDAPSAIQGVAAPNVAGDNINYGYYASGHGKQNLVKCTDCHDSTVRHLDGKHRTYKYIPGPPVQSPRDYQQGYRLNMIGSDYPLVVPRDGFNPPRDKFDPVNEQVIKEYKLCTECHNAQMLLSNGRLQDGTNQDYATNFASRGTDGYWGGFSTHNTPSSALGMLDRYNAHWEHLVGTRNSRDHWNSDYDSDTSWNNEDTKGYDSGMQCVTCHDVHGSKYFAMIRDGRLIGQDKESGKPVDGLEFSYVTRDSSKSNWTLGVSYSATIGAGQFSDPIFTAVDDAGNMYVSDRGGNCIKKFDSTGNFLFKWGGPGSDNGQFSTPLGMAVDSGNGRVYVVDSGNYRIQVFDTDGHYLSQWGGWGAEDGKFLNPYAIAYQPQIFFGESGFVVVTDVGKHNAQLFLPDGAFKVKWGTQGSGHAINNWPGGGGNGNDVNFDRPSGITTTSPFAGTTESYPGVYVSDTGNNRIQAFLIYMYYDTWVGPESVIYVPYFFYELGTEGSGDGQFRGPMSIASGQTGDYYDSLYDNLYVADTINNRIVKIQEDTWNVVENWGRHGAGNGEFDLPQGVATDSSGKIYVVDTGNKRVQKFLNIPSAWVTSIGATRENSVGGVIRVASQRSDQLICSMCHHSDPTPLTNVAPPSYNITDGENLTDYYRDPWPILLSAMLTSPNQITAVFSEPVKASSSDFTDIQDKNGNPLNIASISGNGAAKIVITLNEILTPETAGTLDLGAGITSIANGAALVPIYDQRIWAGY